MSKIRSKIFLNIYKNLRIVSKVNEIALSSVFFFNTFSFSTPFFLGVDRIEIKFQDTDCLYSKEPSNIYCYMRMVLGGKVALENLFILNTIL